MPPSAFGGKSDPGGKPIPNTQYSKGTPAVCRPQQIPPSAPPNAGHNHVDFGPKGVKSAEKFDPQAIMRAQPAPDRERGMFTASGGVIGRV